MIEIISGAESPRALAKLRQLANRSLVLEAALIQTVAGIIDNVRERGDAALIEYTARFDGVTLEKLRVDAEVLRASAARVDPLVLEAIRKSAKRIRAFHLHQREESWETKNGMRLGQRINAIARAGLYVPGGTASYPSSVLMNVIPAQVAGVEQIVVCTPPRTLSENPAVAAALVELGIDEVYSVGGAQAIAALAFGTESIPRVDKITGPGNKYVAAAKKIVAGAVGIDSIAGPSEVVVIADDSASPIFIAADLLAQAEHDEAASAWLLTTSSALADKVQFELTRQLATLPRRVIAEKSLRENGAIFVVADLDEACAIANQIAPEHLQLLTRDDEKLAAKIRHAGAIFFGACAPEALGDYFAGPNHVLPTGGAARFSSALGVYDFITRTSLIRSSCEELAADGKLIAAFARAEGLEAHARSIDVRMTDV
jgi:histidinol dehydrogenase